MSEISKISDIVLCGAIGSLVIDGGCGDEEVKGSIALAHLFCLYAEKYGLDSNFAPDDYRIKLADLMVDYTEMLIQYERCYAGILSTFSNGLRSVFSALNNITKPKLKGKIVELTNNANSYVCRSWGNIGAARCYIAGYVARSLDESRFMTEEVTKNTHNQTDVIKACKSVTDFIFLARCGWPKEAIKGWINCKYKVDGEPACAAYDMDRSCSDIVESYKGKHNAFLNQAKNTVSAALVSVFNADNFDKAIENAKSVGGDQHVVCSIAAELAAALWPISEKYIQKVRACLADKKANGKITIYLGQDYSKKTKHGIEPEEIGKQFNQHYGKLQRDTAPLDWKLKNTKLAIESLKQDLEGANESKKKDILKLLDSVAKDFSFKTQQTLDNDSNLEIKNALMNEIKTLLEQYFPDETKLIDMLKSVIGYDQNHNDMGANSTNALTANQSNTQNLTANTGNNIKNNIVLSTESEDNPKGNNLGNVAITDKVSDNQRFWSKVCDIGKLFVVISASIMTIIFAVNKLWLLFGVDVFVGIVLFFICQLIQNKTCDQKSGLDNLSQNKNEQYTVPNIEISKIEEIPTTEEQTKNQKKQK